MKVPLVDGKLKLRILLDSSHFALMSRKLA